VTTAIHTTCPYCGVGCGVVAQPDGSIKADMLHPANRGRLCSKGAALGATLDDSTRLTVPTVDGREVSWDAALDHIASRFRATIEQHGPDSVAFYVSGQCLTEDYYVANKLMKGFIGSANIDTNSRLCMASSVAAHVRAFGEDVVPGSYDDWEAADLVVLVGSNAAWCHPVLHQRMQAARAIREMSGRMGVVVLDPRRTATAEAADLHLPLVPGSDVALFNGLLTYLHHSGMINRDWVDRYTVGLRDALNAALQSRGPGLQSVAAQCGLDPEALESFYDLFARTERVMTVYSQGVNQSSVGTDKVNAIINCHLATGRIGRPGMGPFSVTGQPNAMGGREVGGMANQLAAHMGFDDASDRAALQAFWASPTLAAKPGLKAIELFDAVLDGRIKAVWVVATNPAVSMPRIDRVRAALAACPLVVVSECWPTDTSVYAHVVLPAMGWGEKDGTVTNSERRISRQRAFRKAPGQARPDWWQFAQVGRRMGWQVAFAWPTPAAIFREHAALSGHANDGGRIFDISPMATLNDSGYDAMQPFRWPSPAGTASEAGRLFAQGGFATADGRARFVPTHDRMLVAQQTNLASLALPRSVGRFLLLNTGRVRDQWHSMTRTGLAPSLMNHTSEPVLTIHPTDAARVGVTQGGLVRITTAEGNALLRVDLRHIQRHGEIFAPIHWTDQFASTGPIGRVVSAKVDPVSGQPELKATSAALTPVETLFHGLLLRRHGGALPDICHWVRVPVAEGQMYRLAGLQPLPVAGDLTRFAAALLEPPTTDGSAMTARLAGANRRNGAEWLVVSDARRGVLRVASVTDGALEACLFLGRDAAALPDEAAVIPMLGAPVPDTARSTILAGQMYAATGAEGARICACFGVSRSAIRYAVTTHQLRTVRDLGKLLRAGTNCGSCIPELEEILRDIRMTAG